MKIQEVKSPGGISAWLVEEHSVPLIALRFAFDGGSAQDPAGKEGLAHFLTAMLDEGAGELDSNQFHERMEEIAMRMSFDEARDAFYGSLETLSENRAQAFALLALALNKPRFENDAVDRIRAQLKANLAYAARDPDRVAGEEWVAMAFPGHPYGRPSRGTAESMAAIGRGDLEAYRAANFAKDNLKIVAVGDIDGATLGRALDSVFGTMPDKARLAPVVATTPRATAKLKVIEMAVPQSVARFGCAAMPRKDKDFMAAFVLNQILGGSGMSSRLWEQVREKRGLAYSVFTSVQPYRHTSIFAGGVATKNEEIAQSLEVIRAEIERIASEGPTETELANAKSYLIGSFALRFDSNAKIANQLLWIMQEGLGKDYVERRNSEIEAVTLEQVRNVAKRLFKNSELIVTVVGRPKGLAPPG
jgi:zinc protease